MLLKPIIATTVAALRTITPARGRVMLAFAPYAFGKGFTAEQAMRAAEQAMRPALRNMSGAKKYSVVVFDVDHEATVDGYGSLHTPANREGPVKVAEVQRTRR